MSLKDRKTKRDAAVQFAVITEKDDKGRAKVVNVPGTEGKTYKVILRRDNGIQVECLCETGCGVIPCKGNSHSSNRPDTICYHAQAAVKASAGKNPLYWCESYEDADRLSHTNHGLIVPITSRQGQGKAYVVFAKKAAKK